MTKNKDCMQSKKKQKTIQAYSIHDIKKLEAMFCTSERSDVCMALFLFHTGLRVSEALNLTIADVEWMESIAVRGKGKKVRIIPLDERVKGVIEVLIRRATQKMGWTEDRNSIPLF